MFKSLLIYIHTGTYLRELQISINPIFFGYVVKKVVQFK